MRRLPVYILIDTSGSMYGEPIEAVKNGLSIMLSTLTSDPYALETAYLSIITFDGTAHQVLPLTEISAVTVPNVEASGCTALGEALSLVSDCIEKEVEKGSNSAKGDWKPLIFITTDGEPTDDINIGLPKFKSLKTGVVVACAAGDGANTDVLKRITENVVSLSAADSESIKSFFKWVSASVSVSSVKVDNHGEILNNLDELPPPPDEINVVL